MTPIPAPSGLGEAEIGFAVDARGFDHALYFGANGHLYYGNDVGGDFAWSRDLGPVPSRLYALGGAQWTVAFSFLNPVTGAVETHVLLNGSEVLIAHDRAPTASALNVRVNTTNVDVAWADTSVHFESISLSRLRLPVLRDEFTDSALDPYAYATNQIYEPFGLPGAFVQAGGLSTVDNENAAFMSYIHTFDKPPASAILRAETRVSSVSDNAIGVGFQLADGSYLAAMVTNDATGTEEHTGALAKHDGLEHVASNATSIRVASWFPGGDFQDVANPQASSVLLTLTYDPGGFATMEVDGRVLGTVSTGTLDVRGVGILSFYQDNVARAEYLHVFETPASRPQTVAPVSSFVARGDVAVAQDALGTPFVAWIDSSATGGLLAQVAYRGAEGWSATVPIALPNLVTSLDMTSVETDPVRHASDLWLAVGLEPSVQVYDVIDAPTLQASVFLYKTIRTQAGTGWALEFTATGTSLTSPAPCLAVSSGSRLALAYRADDAFPVAYWERTSLALPGGGAS